jgi:predicted dienelactone hydrolase
MSLLRIALNRLVNSIYPQSRYPVAAITLGFIASSVVATPTHAAERVRFQYGIFGFSITRQGLETFAETGEIEGSLKNLLSRLDPDNHDRLRGILKARYEVDPVLVNRFSYTSSGKQLLTEVGKLVQTQSGQNGFYALRAALTLAATDAEGLSLLNFIRHFPTDMRINVGRALAIAQELDNIFARTQQIMTRMAANTDAIAISEPAIDFSTLPDPRKPGNWVPSVQTLNLYDAHRDRNIKTNIYIPESVSKKASTRRRPVIVISNGLGARRDRFDELSRHLTSHGFVVVTLDHHGSDRQRLLEFYQGLHDENFEAAEYINRPLDISFLLDELTRLNPKRFENRLDTDRVGVFGYSFGGTTALALAGAKIDRNHLRRNCKTQLSVFNISLLYQCRALELPPASVDLQDNRVQAVYVFVPFSRSLYGPRGMARVEGPVFWEATEQDILTPLVIEQLPSFLWMVKGNSGLENSPGSFPTDHSDRYLVVTGNLPHARVTLDVLNRLTNKSIEWDKIKPIAETYHQMLSLIFFQVYLAKNDVYHPYLKARSVQYLAQSPYEINWGQWNCRQCQEQSEIYDINDLIGS